MAKVPFTELLQRALENCLTDEMECGPDCSHATVEPNKSAVVQHRAAEAFGIPTKMFSYQNNSELADKVQGQTVPFLVTVGLKQYLVIEHDADEEHIYVCDPELVDATA